MLKNILTSCLILFLFSAHGQNEDTFKPVEEWPYYYVAKCEELSGQDKHRCTQLQMLMEVYKNLEYPETAKRQQVEGDVILRFVVNVFGEMEDLQVVKSLGHGCDEEALKVAKSLGKWVPGKKNDQPVETYMNLPIRFSLKSISE